MKNTNDEYISVAEYAKRAKISKQEAYRIIRSPQNAQYITKIDGILHISTCIFQATESQASPPPEAEKEKQESAIIDFLISQIEDLREEIKSKDKQIAETNARIALLLEKQQELTEKALLTTGQAQYLQATNKKQGFISRLLGKSKD